MKESTTTIDHNATIPYTYLIGWSEFGKYYYGVQFGKTANPANLWKTYFTSSRYVKKFREDNGEPDIIEIRKVFDNSESARKWETDVIRKLGLVEDEKWLNRTDNTSKFYFEGPRGPQSQDHRKRLAETRKGRKISKEHKERLHEGRRNSRNSEEHNMAISRASNGKTHSSESRKNMSDGRLKMDSEKRKELARNAGLASSEKYKIDQNRQKAHSERMIQWWADRKMKNIGEGV